MEDSLVQDMYDKGLNGPGGQSALTHGCLCSVLANAAYRTGGAEEPLIAPDCPVHHSAAPGPHPDRA